MSSPRLPMPSPDTQAASALGNLIRVERARGTVAPETIEPQRLRVNTSVVRGLLTRSRTDKHELVIDEPAQFHGTDLAMNPAEVLLAALGASVQVCTRAFADALGIDVHGAEVKLEGQLDDRGFLDLESHASAGICRARVSVAIRGNLTKKELALLTQWLERSCPVLATVRDPTSVDLQITREPSTASNASAAPLNPFRSASDRWDLVYPYEPELGNGASSLCEWAAAGFHHVSVHPAGDNHTAAEALHLVARARREIGQQEGLRVAHTVADIDQAVADGQMAVSIHLEGSRPFERNLDLVGAFHALGVRFCHPVFNRQNSFGGGCAEPDTGISSWGRALVTEFQRVGIMLDGAHVGRKTSLDMIEASDGSPVIFSHNGVDAVNSHFRNLTDDQIRACAATGGVIGLTGMNNYLGGTPVSKIIDHAVYVADLVGPQHLGLGLDVVHDTDALNAFVRSRPSEWPGNWEAFAFAGPADVPSIVDELIHRGFTTEDVHGVLGGNFRRVCEAVWR